MISGIYVDSETTGLRSYFHQIVEVAAVAMDPDGREVDSFSTLANPGKTPLQRMDPQAAATHGITAEILENAPDTLTAARAFQRFLGKYPTAPIHAFNNEFDRGFLVRTPWNVSNERWGECVMKAAQKFMRHILGTFPDGRLRYPSLERAAKFFGVPYDANAHRALPDARMTARIHGEIMARRIEDETADEGRDFFPSES